MANVLNQPDHPDLPGEEWRWAEGWEGMYEVSSFGRLRGLRRRIMRPAVQANGYLGIVFVGKGKPTRFLVHRLVAQAFVPNPEGFDTVDHLDGNKTVNHFANLEWCPIGENRRRAIAMGLAQKPPRRDGRGERNNQAKLTAEQVRWIRSHTYRRGLWTTLAEQLGVSPLTVRYAHNGRNWSHLGE